MTYGVSKAGVLQMTRYAGAHLAKYGIRVNAITPGPFPNEKTLANVEFAQKLADRGIAVRAGLHCAPLAHESAGTLESGTVRISFGHEASREQVRKLMAWMDSRPSIM